MATPELRPTCPDCGVKIGQLHEPGCDIELCPGCGRPRLFHLCDRPPRPPIPWDGRYPGHAECAEFGWFCVRNPRGPGYVPAPPGSPGATHDINRLHAEATWDAAAARFVRPAAAPERRRR